MLPPSADGSQLLHLEYDVRIAKKVGIQHESKTKLESSCCLESVNQDYKNGLQKWITKMDSGLLDFNLVQQWVEP